MKADELKAKIDSKITELIEDVAKYGNAKFSTCDHYNWDREYYNHRNDIVAKLKSEGYSVASSVNWGVIDYVITKPINN